MLRGVYNRFLRPWLPRSWTVYNGVPVRDAGYLDFDAHVPEYKQGVVDAIASVVQVGDDVTIIGFGRGVTTVHAVRNGAAHVNAVDAAAEMLTIGRETLWTAGVEDQVTTQHASVGPMIEVYGDSEDARVIPPADLDTGDVLILDCEGAELEILRGLDSWPRAVVVETHPERGVDPSAVQDAVPEDYATTWAPYEPGAPSDKRVLIATRDREPSA